MFLLAVATWAIFLRPVKATMPRVYVFRAIVLTLISICCITFWLFYMVQVTEGKSILIKIKAWLLISSVY